MKGNARSSPYGLKGLVILGAVAGIVGCSAGGSKPSDSGTTGSAGGGVSREDFARLQERVDTLEAYRARNADFVAKLSASYSHFYYCDATSQHKDANQCAPMQSHITPPKPPPK